MSKKLPRCDHCHRSYRPDRHNTHHQKYCRDPVCVRERKRQRQREWDAKRRAEDPDFRRKGNSRCAAANRRRRAAEKERRDAPVAPLPPELLPEVVLGLLSQLTDIDDPADLRTSVHQYAARGQRLACIAPTGTDPP
ncbi:MAG: hypothetical protein HN742_40325 [Lentisphaerae bacterium]|nr:hypothetical protein [Lentisphaerota bacterium]MBT7056687.1 hypothetical protein [Lentisphaerota bacterium]MBT7848183.1 hypothetical protein [Lentisphaerota bacterium]